MTTKEHIHVKSPGHDIKQSEDEAPVMLKLWGMVSSLSLPSLPGPHWAGMVAPDSPMYGSNRIVWHLNRVQTNGLLLLLGE